MNLPPEVHRGALLLAIAAMTTAPGCAPSPVAAVDGRGGGAGGAGSDAAPAIPDVGAPDEPASGDGAASERASADAVGPADAAGDASAPRDATAAPDAIGPGRPGWTLVWADEFDTDGPPSSADWNFERGFVRNEELQWYQADNAVRAGGLLVIEARPEQRANPNYQAGSGDWKRNRQNITYTSTSMTTSGKHAFLYGRFEIRARIDTRSGSWPAFWVLGGGSWPASGEIDIMEFYRNTVLANVCKPANGNCDWSSTRQSLASLGGAAWTSQFHVWAMEWDADKIDLFLDDKLANHFVVSTAVGAGQQNPYVGRQFYMLVNLAVGGTNGGDPAGATLRYEVDWVRVYQKSAN